MPASAGSPGTVLLADSFTKSTVTSPEYLVGGTGADASNSSRTNEACLTVAGSPVGQAPASCTGAADSQNNGALRLTAASGTQAGFLLYNHALPASAGLDITFDQYQYGGSGADGITFFLTDGQYALNAVGASGGSLGYHNSTSGSGSGQPGIAHALLGVAFDAYGNFVHETNNASCNTPTSWTSALDPQSVAVRGPGVLGTDGKWDDGYCLLGAAVNPAGGIDDTAASTRPAAIRKVEIIVDPPGTTNPQVSVYLGAMGDASATPTLVTQVPEPAALTSVSTFKFGWSASTGGSTDVHEVNNLQVDTVDTLSPSLMASASNPAAVAADGTANATFQASTLSAAGPIAAGTAVTATVTKPDALDWGSIPASVNGWSLQSSVGDQAVFTYTSANIGVPGESLPDLSVPVTGATAGDYSVTDVLSGGGIDTTLNPVGDRTASSTIAITPVAGDVSATTDPASSTPPAKLITTPSPVGGGTPSYAIVAGPTSAEGTASIDPSSGVVSFTPKAGTSGITTFSYDVTVNGETSAPATVTVTTPPAVTDKSKTVGYGTAGTVDLSNAAIGSGLGYQIASGPPVGAGTAAVSGSTLTFTPATGFSGNTTLTYTATDSDSVTSAPATVTITVLPQAHTDTLATSLQSDGSGSASSTLPTPDGTGPFTYALVTGPSTGTATINSDGSYSYTAAQGQSGIFTATYSVTDGAGVVSAPVTLTFNVKPYAAPVSGSTTAGQATTLDAPDTVGASNGSFVVTQPSSGGTASIDPATGDITFTPAVGTSGIVTFSYSVTANGVTSDPATVSIDVDPTVTNHAVSTNYGQATTVDLTDGAVGTSLAYSIVTPSADGAATVDASTGQLAFTPNSGYSGVTTLTYRATDGDALNSATKTVTVTVLPQANAGSTTVTIPESGTGASTFDVPTPSGTGPFTYTIVPGSETPGLGSYSIDSSGTVTFTPVAGTSGVSHVQYTVTDGSNGVSGPQDLTVTVLPFAAVVTQTSDTGSDTDVLPAPVVSGTGPFTYALTSSLAPSVGTATIDPTTGVITFIPADSTASGIVDFTYTVTDTNGLTSTGSTAALNIRPTVAAVSGSGSGALIAPQAIVIAPHPVGTGPFTYRVVGSTPHLTVVPTATGFTVTPDPGYSGKVSFQFVAVDADGVASAVQTADVSITAAATGLAFTGADNVDGMIAIGGLGLLLGAALFAYAVARRRRAAAEPTLA